MGAALGGLGRNWAARAAADISRRDRVRMASLRTPPNSRVQCQLLLTVTARMNPNFLEFEQPIAELEAKIRELKLATADVDINLTEEIAKLQGKLQSLTENIFSKLTPWQVSQLARHPQRPYTLDYIARIFTDFEELHGDRHFGDDAAIVAGMARFDDRPVMIIGQQKGRETKEKLRRNFGMPRPEGYRKALRMLKMAERFNMPVITLIDTTGAWPGIDAEERNQSEAIARNLMVMAELKVPIIATVIGEGGSGGALAIGVADRVNMLQHSTYSVISPEGCASILWKNSDKAADAAAAMGITAARLKELELVDTIIEEPLGGAHRDFDAIAQSLRTALQDSLNEVVDLETKELIAQRRARLRAYGRFSEA